MSLFFFAGAGVSFVSGESLLLPGGFLEPMWRLNPRAHVAFDGMGAWAIVLMTAVCLACALSAMGLWRGRRWGYRLAIGLLVANLLGDIANVVLGTEPRAAVGVPVAAALLAYLMRRRVRGFFGTPAGV